MAQKLLDGDGSGYFSNLRRREKNFNRLLQDRWIVKFG